MSTLSRSSFLLLLLTPALAWAGPFGQPGGSTGGYTVEADHVYVDPHFDANNNVVLGDGGSALTTGAYNVLIGNDTGDGITTGEENYSLGSGSTLYLQTGVENAYMGTDSGNNRAPGATNTGSWNVGIGTQSMWGCEGCDYNTSVGWGAGGELQNGTYNTLLGEEVLYSGGDTSYNTCVGALACEDLTGDGNVVLGYMTAEGQTAISNQLWIDNSDTATPLIYGDFDANTVDINGTFTVDPYVRHLQLPATLTGNPSAQPTWQTFGTAPCLQFASAGTAQTVYVTFEIGDEWVGGEDMTFEVDWLPDSGATSGTDTVEWDVTYRAVAEGETITNGTAVTATVEDDGDYAQYVTQHSQVTLDYDNANQPLVHEDHVFLAITRDTGNANDFAGTVCVTAFEVIYNADKMPETN